jgi:hypothetical protein
MVQLGPNPLFYFLSLATDRRRHPFSPALSEELLAAGRCRHPRPPLTPPLLAPCSVPNPMPEYLFLFCSCA